MWSVVHLPLALISTTAPVMFLAQRGVPNLWLHHHFHAAAVLGGGFEAGVLHIITLGWHLHALRLVQLHHFAFLVHQLVGERAEVDELHRREPP